MAMHTIVSGVAQTKMQMQDGGRLRACAASKLQASMLQHPQKMWRCGKGCGSSDE